MTKTDEVYAKVGLATNALVVFCCLSVAVIASAQPPDLSKAQRTTLQAMVRAVDAAATQPPAPNSSWTTHVLRASDGSHYVAFSVEPTGDQKLPAGPVLLYVRLATARPTDGAAMTAERSPLGEWLAGQRVDPRLLPGRGIAIGEMPAFGAGAIGVRGSTASTGSMDLKLMAMERERARQEKEDADKLRRAELGGKETVTRGTLPFEDFDPRSQSVAADGRRIISRALTAGPGDYELFLAWADPAARRPADTIHVSRTVVTLPIVNTDALATSSLILADSIAIRPSPYTAAEQASHPYSIGLTEIVPARDASFTRDERLNVAFQVINARPGETGKPDVRITFRIVRVDGERELPFATLNPQSYDDASMPADFDLRLGHPLLAAMSAPLGTLPRDRYRLKVTVSDRRAGTARTEDAAFTVIGTAASLLGEAPPLGRSFQREMAIAASALAEVVLALTPEAPSAAMKQALDVAAKGRFIDLLLEDAVPAAEQSRRVALTGLALYAIGDASAALRLQRALDLGAPPAPIHFLVGAARALQGRDAEAIAAWQLARNTGMPSALVTPLMVDAHLRRTEGPQAAALVAEALGARLPDGVWWRPHALSLLATGRDLEAIVALDAHLSLTPDDAEARWLLLQALYSSIVHGNAGSRARFAATARQYLAAEGAHGTLVADWLAAVGDGGL